MKSREEHLRERQEYLKTEWTKCEAEIEELKRAKAPRDRELWLDFEKDILIDNLTTLVKTYAKKFGRSENALWWRIEKLSASQKTG